MDKWVTKITKEPRIKKKSPEPERNFVQARIEDLRKVIPLKRIVELKEKLLELETLAFTNSSISTSSSSSSSTNPDSHPNDPSRISTDVESSILLQLHNLSSMYIALEILEETGIGKIIYRYRKHPNKEISELADTLYQKWRNDAKESIIQREKKQSLGIHTEPSTSCRVTFVQKTIDNISHLSTTSDTKTKRARDTSSSSSDEEVTDLSTTTTIKQAKLITTKQQQQQAFINQQLHNVMYDANIDIEKDIEDWDRVCNLAAQSRYERIQIQQQPPIKPTNINHDRQSSHLSSSLSTNILPVSKSIISTTSIKPSLSPVLIPPPPALPKTGKVSGTIIPSVPNITSILSPSNTMLSSTKTSPETIIPPAINTMNNRHVIQNRTTIQNNHHPHHQIISLTSNKLPVNTKNPLSFHNNSSIPPLPQVPITTHASSRTATSNQLNLISRK